MEMVNGGNAFPGGHNAMLCSALMLLCYFLFSFIQCFCKSRFTKSHKYVNTDILLELIFVNQLRNASAPHPGLVENTIELSAKGDFIVKSEYTFEIGGKGKGFNQISGIEKSFVVADDIETGFQNKIPLWLFGFLY